MSKIEIEEERFITLREGTKMYYKVMDALIQQIAKTYFKKNKTDIWSIKQDKSSLAKFHIYIEKQLKLISPTMPQIHTNVSHETYYQDFNGNACFIWF